MDKSFRKYDVTSALEGFVRGSTRLGNKPKCIPVSVSEIYLLGIDPFEFDKQPGFPFSGEVLRMVDYTYYELVPTPNAVQVREDILRSLKKQDDAPKPKESSAFSFSLETLSAINKYVAKYLEANNKMPDQVVLSEREFEKLGWGDKITHIDTAYGLVKVVKTTGDAVAIRHEYNNQGIL